MLYSRSDKCSQAECRDQQSDGSDARRWSVWRSGGYTTACSGLSRRAQTLPLRLWRRGSRACPARHAPRSSPGAEACTGPSRPTLGAISPAWAAAARWPRRALAEAASELFKHSCPLVVQHYVLRHATSRRGMSHVNRDATSACDGGLQDRGGVTLTDRSKYQSRVDGKQSSGVQSSPRTNSVT